MSQRDSDKAARMAQFVERTLNSIAQHTRETDVCPYCAINNLFKTLNGLVELGAIKHFEDTTEAEAYDSPFILNDRGRFEVTDEGVHAGIRFRERQHADS